MCQLEWGPNERVGDWMGFWAEEVGPRWMTALATKRRFLRTVADRRRV